MSELRLPPGATHPCGAVAHQGLAGRAKPETREQFASAAAVIIALLCSMAAWVASPLRVCIGFRCLSARPKGAATVIIACSTTNASSQPFAVNGKPGPGPQRRITPHSRLSHIVNRHHRLTKKKKKSPPDMRVVLLPLVFSQLSKLREAEK